MRGIGTPILIAGPRLDVNRWIEGGLLEVLGQKGIGCIASRRWPCASTGKYAERDPRRLPPSQPSCLAVEGPAERQDADHVAALSKIAAARRQTLGRLRPVLGAAPTTSG